MLGKGNVGRPDTPGVSTAEMQRIMDELPREVLAPAFNELAGQLEAETAAADIGAAAPEGVTAAPAGKLQAVLNGLRDLVKAHTDRADNPHGVTAAQAGAYSKAETDAAISAKVVELGAGDMAKSIYDPGNEQQPLLPRNGDGSNVTASFTEAEQDADIQTGEELTVLFGKIKKRFSTYDADGDGVVDRAAAADRVAKKFILQNNAGQQIRCRIWTMPMHSRFLPCSRRRPRRRRNAGSRCKRRPGRRVRKAAGGKNEPSLPPVSRRSRRDLRRPALKHKRRQSSGPFQSGKCRRRCADGPSAFFTQKQKCTPIPDAKRPGHLSGAAVFLFKGRRAGIGASKDKVWPRPRC